MRLICNERPDKVVMQCMKISEIAYSVFQVFCQTLEEELACPTSIGWERNAEKAPAGT